MHLALDVSAQRVVKRLSSDVMQPSDNGRG